LVLVFSVLPAYTAAVKQFAENGTIELLAPY
jgi:hypothetical protein